MTSKNNANLCKLDVNVQNRMAVAGSVGFFNLSRNSLKEKVLLYSKLHGPSMLPDKEKFVVCSIISLALSFWMKHLVIGQLQKPAKFSAFHWSTSRSQAVIGQLLGNSRVVHLPKRTAMVLFTISDA